MTYGQWTLERDIIPPNAADSLVGDRSLSVFQGRSNIDRLPLDGGL